MYHILNLGDTWVPPFCRSYTFSESNGYAEFYILINVV